MKGKGGAPRVFIPVPIPCYSGYVRVYNATLFRNIRYVTAPTHSIFENISVSLIILYWASLTCRCLSFPLQVPKNSDIFISVWNLHHSAKSWDEPNAFNPDRWTDLLVVFGCLVFLLLNFQLHASIQWAMVWHCFVCTPVLLTNAICDGLHFPATQRS